MIYFKIEIVLPEQVPAFSDMELTEMSWAQSEQFQKEIDAEAHAQRQADIFKYPFAVVRVYEQKRGTYGPKEA